MARSDGDLVRLRRCIELAHAALRDGDEPFGSILVDADGPTACTESAHPAEAFADELKALYAARFRP